MAIFLGVLFFIVCLLLIVVVLIQKGRGGGLGAAFGGAASSAFGTKVGDVLTWVTIVLVALFLLLAIGTTVLMRPKPGIVAAPFFKPAPAEYVRYEVPAYVKIACETPQADIYYTVDGSAPDKDSETASRFQGTARVNAGQTLKARAYREGWTPSRISEGYYGPPVAPQTMPTSMPESQPALETPPVE